MEIVQRSFLSTARFVFDPVRLTYELKTLRGTRRFTIDYVDLVGDVQHVEQRYILTLVVGAIVTGVGALFGASVYFTERRLAGFSFSLIGMIFLANYFLQRKRYAVIFTPRTSIMVFSGKLQAPILNEVTKRRKERFLRLLEREDIASNDVQRRSLIASLRDQNMLSDSEVAQLLGGRTMRSDLH